MKRKQAFYPFPLQEELFYRPKTKMPDLRRFARIVLIIAAVCLSLEDARSQALPGSVTVHPERRHFLPEEASPTDPPFVDAAALHPSGLSQAISLPSGFFVEEIAPGNSFATPVAVAFAPDGRIFVVEKRGRVYVVDNGVKLSTPFINLESEVLNHWDRGLLGFALDPDFATTGHVYLLYTVDRDGSGDYTRQDVSARLTRYTVDAGNPNVVDTSTRHVLIGETFSDGIPSCYYSHTIGTLQFGSDGTLMVGAGDGAHFGQVDAGGLQPTCFGAGLFPPSEDVGAFRSQYLGSLAGKMLRIDPATGLGLPSNPFWTGNADDNQSKVWVRGLRNPYRYTLRRDGSTDPTAGDPGTLFIGDVGWGVWEDLHVAASGGENFGWPCYEGPNQHSAYQNATPAHSDCSVLSGHDAPVYYWHHSNANLSLPTGLMANAIVVGDIYTGFRYPQSYNDRIFYSDYTRGWIASSAVSTGNSLSDHQVFATGAGAVVDVRFDPVSSYVYYVDVAAGQVWRLRHDNENAPPVAIASADVQDGYSPLLVQFTGDTSYDPDSDPITYHWDFGDGTTSTAANPTHTFTSTGTFQVVLTVADDVLATNQAYLQIAVNNTYPAGQLLTPENGVQLLVGQTVALSGDATDNEDADSELVYEWRVMQRHNSHDHPDFFHGFGKIASFEIEEHGLPYEVSFLRIQLVVTDTGGLTDTTEHVVEVKRRGEHDITGDGTPVALVTTPVGSGNTDIGVIADGLFPDAGSTDPQQHYDTFSGGSKAIDWIGYTFAEPRYLSKLLLQQGVQSSGGGWFDSMDVQARVDGVWQDVAYLHSLRPYEGDNGVHYDRYTLLFEGVWADGIRLIGAPGGTDDFVSIGELRVFELPVVEFASTVTSGAGPLSVSFADHSSVAGAWTWTWDFGDGYGSSDRNPQHTFQQPGAYDVSLTITSPDGAFSETKNDFIVVGAPGLTGQYFDNIDFTGTRIVRTDAEIDFEWGAGAPDPSMGTDQFSVRWTGWVEAEYSETYTFHTVTDDGIRLWIDGQLIIDKWIDQAPREWTGTIALESGKFYPVFMEYYENGGGAVAHLDWSSASQARQTIPSARLRAGALGPRVSNFDPPYGDYNATVHIYGENLATTSTVRFNGHAASSFGVVSAGHIWAEVPETATSGPVEVVTPDGSTFSVEPFGVNDGTLPVELEKLRAVISSQGVRVDWRTTRESTAAGFGIEYARDGSSTFEHLAYVPAERGQNDYYHQTTMLSPGEYAFRLHITDLDGSAFYSQVLDLHVRPIKDVVVEPVFPNPFSASATLVFSTAEAQFVEVSLYDMLGRRLEVLFADDVEGGYPNRIRVGSGELPSGIYLVRLRGTTFVKDVAITRVGGR